jgi:lipopolysaccharide export LptBFGC system permease protein LptF
MKKTAKELLQYVLAALIVICFFGFIALLLFMPIPKENTETLNLGAGALLIAFGTVVGYFFGSSAGSQRKTDMLTKLEHDENK